jgi:hypothetical protein
VRRTLMLAHEPCAKNSPSCTIVASRQAG